MSRYSTSTNNNNYPSSSSGSNRQPQTRQQSQTQISKQTQLQDQNFSLINSMMVLSTFESIQHNYMYGQNQKFQKRFGGYDFCDYSLKNLAQLKDQAQTQLMSIEMSKLIFQKTHGKGSYKFPNSFDQNRLKSQLQRFYNIFHQFDDKQCCAMIQDLAKIMLTSHDNTFVPDRNFGSYQENQALTSEKKKSIITQTQHAGKVMQDKLKQFRQSGITNAQDIQINIKPFEESLPFNKDHSYQSNSSTSSNFQKRKIEPTREEVPVPLFNSSNREVGFIDKFGEARFYQGHHFYNDFRLFDNKQNVIGYLGQNGKIVYYQSQQTQNKNNSISNQTNGNKEWSNFSNNNRNHRKQDTKMEIQTQTQQAQNQHENISNKESQTSSYLEGDTVIFGNNKKQNPEIIQNQNGYKNQKETTNSQNNANLNGNQTRNLQSNQNKSNTNNVKRGSGVLVYENNKYHFRSRPGANQRNGGIYNQRNAQIGYFYTDDNGFERRVYYHY